MLKTIIIATCSATTVFVAGCASTQYSYGRNFDTDSVKQIIKGQTTSAELVALIGQPYTKSVVNDTDEKWVYMHASGSASVQSYVITMNVQSIGQQKMLDVLIRGGTVVNYTLTEGNSPYSSSTKSGQ